MRSFLFLRSSFDSPFGEKRRIFQNVSPAEGLNLENREDDEEDEKKGVQKESSEKRAGLREDVKKKEDSIFKDIEFLSTKGIDQKDHTHEIQSIYEEIKKNRKARKIYEPLQESEKEGVIALITARLQSDGYDLKGLDIGVGDYALLQDNTRSIKKLAEEIVSICAEEEVRMNPDWLNKLFENQKNIPFDWGEYKNGVPEEENKRVLNHVRAWAKSIQEQLQDRRSEYDRENEPLNKEKFNLEFEQMKPLGQWRYERPLNILPMVTIWSDIESWTLDTHGDNVEIFYDPESREVRTENINIEKIAIIDEKLRVFSAILLDPENGKKSPSSTFFLNTFPERLEETRVLTDDFMGISEDPDKQTAEILPLISSRANMRVERYMLPVILGWKGSEKFLAENAEQYWERGKKEFANRFTTIEQKELLVKNLDHALESTERERVDFEAVLMPDNLRKKANKLSLEYWRGENISEERKREIEQWFEGGMSWFNESMQRSEVRSIRRGEFMSEEYENTWNTIQKFCYRREQQIPGFTAWLREKMKEYKEEIGEDIEKLKAHNKAMDQIREDLIEEKTSLIKYLRNSSITPQDLEIDLEKIHEYAPWYTLEDHAFNLEDLGRIALSPEDASKYRKAEGEILKAMKKKKEQSETQYKELSEAMSQMREDLLPQKTILVEYLKKHGVTPQDLEIDLEKIHEYAPWYTLEYHAFNLEAFGRIAIGIGEVPEYRKAEEVVITAMEKKKIQIERQGKVETEAESAGEAKERIKKIDLQKDADFIRNQEFIETNNISVRRESVSIEGKPVYIHVFEKSGHNNKRNFIVVHDTENTAFDTALQAINDGGKVIALESNEGRHIIGTNIEPNRVFLDGGKYAALGEKMTELLGTKGRIIALHNNYDGVNGQEKEGKGNWDIEQLKNNGYKNIKIFRIPGEDTDNAVWMSSSVPYEESEKGRREVQWFLKNQMNVVYEYVPKNNPNDTSLANWAAINDREYYNVEIQHGNAEAQKRYLDAVLEKDL